MRSRLAVLWLGGLLAINAQAHVVSISTGELQMDGPTAVFELRIPMYEVTQVTHPETTLLDQFRFGDGHLVKSSCHQEEGFYVCRGDYEFPGLHPDTLAVRCTLFQVTVPNHIHILTATQGSNTDQQVFDQRFSAGTVRFHPPSPAERIARDVTSGSMRAIESAGGILFLVALALAARTRRELLLLGAVFLAAECAARPIGPLLPLGFSARSLEAVLGLTVAYLAMEVLLLPEGKSRWIVVALLGLCHGFSLAGLPVAYLAGVLPVQGVLLAAFSIAALKMPATWRRPSAALLVAAGVGWFALRLWR